MNVLLLLLMMAGDPANCPLHEQHSAQHTAVDERGDRVMGFSHETTKHTFRLLEEIGRAHV